MSVIVTDLRTIINEADNTTGWTGSPTLFTADPSPVEATGCIGYVVSNNTTDAFVTVGAQNLSNTLIYVWAFPRGAMDTTANGGVSIHLGDGTNRIAFHIAGSDNSGFRHDIGPVGWNCLVLDTSSLPATITTRAGSLASLNLSSITQIGITFKTLVKSVGGVSNCFVDIIRVGDPTTNNGAMLRITGGNSSDTGKFTELVSLDRSTTNQRAYGIIRENNLGSFGIQGSLSFGNVSGTDSSWFEDKNSSIIFESRGLSTSRYGITIRDNGVGTTTFILGEKVGSGSEANGTAGCSIVSPIGTGAFWDSKSDTNVDSVFLYGSTFSGFSGGFLMRAGQEFIGSVLTQSGTFEPTGASVINSTISTSTATVAVDVGSISHMNSIVNCSFSGNNRAIRLTSPGTYNFDGLIFSGNTYDIENASAGLITINALNGSNVSSFINTNSGTTEIINAKSLVISNIIENSEVRIIRQSDDFELGGVENVSNPPIDANNVVVEEDLDNIGRFKLTYNYGYSSDIPIWIIIFHVEYQPIFQNFILRVINGSLISNQVIDRQYDRGTIFNPS